jgi:hypothetical protein
MHYSMSEYVSLFHGNIFSFYHFSLTVKQKFVFAENIHFKDCLTMSATTIGLLSILRPFCSD